MDNYMRRAIRQLGWIEVAQMDGGNQQDMIKKNKEL
jgi:hypothetical protein